MLLDILTINKAYTFLFQSFIVRIIKIYGRT